MVSKGCENSPHRIALYGSVEGRLSLLTSNIIKSAAVITAIVWGGTFLVPISYAIFGSPKPDHWTRVYDVR